MSEALRTHLRFSRVIVNQFPLKKNLLLEKYKKTKRYLNKFTKVFKHGDRKRIYKKFIKNTHNFFYTFHSINKWLLLFIVTNHAETIVNIIIVECLFNRIDETRNVSPVASSFYSKFKSEYFIIIIEILFRTFKKKSSHLINFVEKKFRLSMFVRPQFIQKCITKTKETYVLIVHFIVVFLIQFFFFLF